MPCHHRNRLPVIKMDCQAFNSGYNPVESDQPLVKAPVFLGTGFKLEQVVKFLLPDNGHLLDLKIHSFSSPRKVCFGSRVQVATDTKD